MKVLIPFFVCLSGIVCAQSPETYSGRVSDSTSRLALRNVQVTVLGPDAKVLDVKFTDSTGRFTVKQGQQVLLSALGYSSVTLSHRDFSGTKNEFFLSLRVKALAEVSIVRPALTYESDRIIFAFSSNLPFQGKTLLQTIENVPMLFFDEKRILHYNGQSNLALTLNGKPVLVQGQSLSSFLASLPTDKVIKVEIITDVLTKYKVNGAVAVVNVVTTPNIQGVSYAVKAGADTRFGYILGGNFGVRTKRIGITGNLNHDNSNTFPGTFYYATSSGNQVNEQFRAIESSNTSLNAELRMSLEIDTLTLLNVNIVRYLPRNVAVNRIYSGSAIGENEPYLLSNQTSKRGFTDYSFDFERLIGLRKHVLTASFNHNVGIQDWSFDNQDSLGLRKEEVKSRGKESVVQADFLYRFQKLGTFEVGVRNINRHFTNDKEFSYKQNIVSNYYGMRYNTSTQEYFRVGVRLEYTAFDRISDEFNFIPSASWSRVLPKNRSVSFTYAMGLRRPQLAFVNPAINRSNPQYISHGNPDLAIEKIQQFTLSYNSRWLNSPLALSLYGTTNPNAVQQYLYTVNPETFAMSYANTGKVFRLGATAFFSKTWFKKLTFRVNYQGGYQGISSKVSDDKNSNFEYKIFGTLSYRNRKAYTFAFNTYTYSKTTTYQGYTGGFSDMRFSLSKWYFNSSLSARAVVYQPFSDAIRIQNEVEDKWIKQYSVSHFNARYLGLELNYYFQKGKDEIVKSKKRGIIQTDK